MILTASVCLVPNTAAELFFLNMQSALVLALCFCMCNVHRSFAMYIGLETQETLLSLKTSFSVCWEMCK